MTNDSDNKPQDEKNCPLPEQEAEQKGSSSSGE